MRRSWAVGLLIISILAMACGGAADVDDYKAAFVYLGSANDGGWTQAHDEGRQYLVEQTGIETAFTEDIPPDATEFRTVAEAYIEQGYNIIFGTTFGYLDIMEEMALEYPDVIFLHCSGYKSNASNYTNYFGKIYEARYLSGLAAGSLTESNKIGYVAAFPIPEVIRGINAFANASLMLNKISSVLSILSFIISVTTIAAGYAGYRYITSPQFEAMMMEKVMEGVGKILPNQIDKKLPKVTGPMLPL